ncbi:MAG TPA: hypothetical protein VHY76_05445 [Acetobacteraceae bacterium]|nr:hypothetical protein [Acetobacteraceae bacterium]
MAKPASDQDKTPERHEEAEKLAREALQERQAGHKDEAKFVLDEARKLDPEAVQEVLHETPKPAAPGKSPAKSPGKH